MDSNIVNNMLYINLSAENSECAIILALKCYSSCYSVASPSELNQVMLLRCHEGLLHTDSISGVDTSAGYRIHLFDTYPPPSTKSSLLFFSLCTAAHLHDAGCFHGMVIQEGDMRTRTDDIDQRMCLISVIQMRLKLSTGRRARRKRVQLNKISVNIGTNRPGRPTLRTETGKVATANLSSLDRECRLDQ